MGGGSKIFVESAAHSRVLLVGESLIEWELVLVSGERISRGHFYGIFYGVLHTNKKKLPLSNAFSIETSLGLDLACVI